ncbi:MAG: hypothetical protein IJE46_01765 [Clostridia bacterium]|nr:hypothetical protein [Clostridia bacterium]
MKRFMSILLCAIMLILAPICVTAAPATISPSATSATSNLVVITNPPYFTSTTQKGVVFCGYGTPGTKITFYMYGNDTYTPIISNSQPVTVTINASGVFWKKVNFTTGYHKVIVYAEKNGADQIVKREINVLGYSLADKMKDYTINIAKDLLVKGR